MKLTVTIEMDNAAFSGGNASETARILTKLAKTIARQTNINGKFDLPLQDANGNNVGAAKVTSETLIPLTFIGPDGDSVVVTFNEANNETPIDIRAKPDTNIDERYPDYRWPWNDGWVVCNRPSACYDKLLADGYKPASDEQFWIDNGHYPS